MNPAWLSQLAPDRAPAPPGWWPLAPGWWALLILLVILVAVLIYRYLRPAMRTRRAGLRELRRLDALALDDHELARRLEHLMRRYALTRYGHEQVAGLSGTAWIEFVVRHQGTALAGEAGAEFLRAAWGKPVGGQRQQWMSAAHAFIKDQS